MKEITFPHNRPEIDLGDIEKPKNTLEFKTIVFTVVLYFFICAALLTVHYVAPYLPLAPNSTEGYATWKAPNENDAEKSSEKTGDYQNPGTSSGSPHNPR